MNFTQFDYDSHADKIRHYTPERRVDGLNYYGDLSVDLSAKVFAQSTRETTIQTSQDVGLNMQMVKVKKAVLAGDNFQITGCCKSPYLTLGTRLTLYFGEEELGQYLVSEVEHVLENNNQYRSTFKAIAGDTLIIPAPILTAPAAEPQLAVVKNNDDPQGQGRVRVQFQWQQESYMSDWIRVASPDGGGSDGVGVNRGFVFVPEVGDQVFVSFLNNNPDKPFVSGSAFHGNNSSGQSHAIRTIMTKSGHSIELNDQKGGTSIRIKDKSGNDILLDTKGSNITITAPETMTLKAKNIQMIAEETITSQAGKNIRTSAREEISQDSGKKTIIASGDNTEISASKDLDLYGKKQLIGYSDGKVDIGAKKAIHIYGVRSLITAKDKIEYKAPSMNKLAESGKFKYDKEKRIISAVWMDDKMEKVIKKTLAGKKISLLVQTRNYEEGEAITVKIKEKEGQDIQEGAKELTLTGIVNKDGFAELKEQIEIRNIQDKPKAKMTNELKKEERETDKKLEQKEWEIQVVSIDKNKKRFW